MKCKKCNSEKFTIIENEPHIGLYCAKCGAWVKWIKRKDIKIISKICNIVE